MPEVILADSRMDTMEGYYPNRKPVGNVKIDWDHPLAAYLTFCTVFSQGKLYDMVTNREAASIKIERSSDGSISSPAARSDWHVLFETGTMSVDEITIILWMDSFSTSSWESYLAIETAEGGLLSLDCNASGEFRIYDVGSSLVGITTVTASPDVGSPLIWTASAKANESQLFCGKLSSSIETHAPTLNEVTSIQICGRQGATNRSQIMTVPACYGFSKKLNQEELESLHNHPYQFLIPAG